MSKTSLLKPGGKNPNALATLQGYSLAGKIAHTERKITEWYNHWEGQVYISFSGGKDSTVLLHIARRLYPDIPAVFSDTGLEFPEIREFVKTIENVTWVKPKMSFYQVLQKYGYPIISKEQACYIDQYRNTQNEKLREKRWNGKEGHVSKIGKISEKWKYLVDAPFKISDRCCYVMKKAPLKSYESKTKRKPIIAIMAEESSLRSMNYRIHGCNAFNLKRPVSNPMTFWGEDDVWGYLRQFEVPYAEIYKKGYQRTGCIFCAFGCHLEKPENRFQKLKRTHPKLYSYCMDKLGMRQVLDWYLGERKDK